MTWEVAKDCCKKVSAISAFGGSYRKWPLEGVPKFKLFTGCLYTLIGAGCLYVYIKFI